MWYGQLGAEAYFFPSSTRPLDNVTIIVERDGVKEELDLSEYQGVIISNIDRYCMCLYGCVCVCMYVCVGICMQRCYVCCCGEGGSIHSYSNTYIHILMHTYIEAYIHT
jgi:hypothetical protein